MRPENLRTALVYFAYAYAALLPFSIAAGSVLSGVLISGGLALLAIDPGARRHLDRPVWIALLAIILWLTLATALSSPHPAKWKDWGQLLWLKLHVVTTAAILLGRPRHAVRILGILILASVAVAALGIGQHFTGRLPFEDEIPPMRGSLWEIEGYYGHHLTYGGHVLVMWLAALALALNLWSRPRRGAWPFVAAGAVVILSLALFWSYARSAQIGAVGGAIALAFTLPRRMKAAVAGILAIAFVAAMFSPQMRSRFAELGDLGNEETRINLWTSSWSGIQERPWTGYGPGNFGSMMATHEVEGFYNAKSHAHNDWIMHAVIMGLPGAALALSFFLAMALALRRRLTVDVDFSWIASAALAAIVGIAVGGLFQVFQSDDEVEMVLFFVVGCALSLGLPAGRPDRAPVEPR